MGIPESQLQTWERASQTDTAVRAHEEIRRYLLDSTWLINESIPLWMVDFEIFLQGSYANTTNVRGDSDVDVVVLLKSPWYYNVDALDWNNQIRFQAAHPAGNYSFWQFHGHVLQALRAAFNWSNVTPGNKAIKVVGEGGVKLDADVLPCVLHRRYYAYNGDDQFGCHEGVIFFHQTTGVPIINYPKQHMINGVAKHQATNSRFKPTVRLFKNLRNHMISNGLLSEEVAPSYFIQGLLYNVPDDQFATNQRLNFLNVLLWLGNNCRQFENFVSQNGVLPLFGESSEQWRLADALTFVTSLIDLEAEWQ